MKKISVIGIGWLGFPAAVSFLKTGNKVFGSTTSSDKIELLNNSDISPFLFDINNFNENDLTEILNVDLLILNFPPSSVKMESFISFINLIPDKIKKIIFTSSISVYGEQFGIINEENSLLAESINGIKLIQIENELLKLYQNKTVILRLAGLVGEGRDPGNFLAGRNNLKDGELNINLVHLEDCINIINFFVENNLTGIYNVCENFHPTKKEFYTKAAININLTPPEFLESNEKKTKIISSEKIINNLNYKFSDNVKRYCSISSNKL